MKEIQDKALEERERLLANLSKAREAVESKDRELSRTRRLHKESVDVTDKMADKLIKYSSAIATHELLIKKWVCTMVIAQRATRTPASPDGTDPESTSGPLSEHSESSTPCP